MAAAAGVSASTVGRIWRAHGLKPHRVKTFKLSNDPRFAEKLDDIVGLYLNPPEPSLVVLSPRRPLLGPVQSPLSAPALDRVTPRSGPLRLRLRSKSART